MTSTIDTPPITPSPREPWRGRLIVLAISACVFTMACAMPAVQFGGDRPDTMWGLAALGLGWQALLVGQFAWLGNLVWLLSVLLILLRRWIAASFFALVAFALGLTALTMIGQEIPGDEGNVTKQHIVAFYPGYYLWLMAFLVTAIGAIALRVTAAKRSA